MKEQNKTLGKEPNKMEISKLSDAECKTLVIRMLKELTGYFNSIKKAQAEMQVTLSEIKKNLWGTNRGGDVDENKINGLEHKEEKNIPSEWQEEKESKEMRIGSGASGTSSSTPTFASQGCQKEKRKSKKLKTYLKK